jgi:hypothetical protein
MTGKKHEHDLEELAHEVQEVGEEISAARRTHREAQGRPEGHTFSESGTVHPELDDQTIAPG